MRRRDFLKTAGAGVVGYSLLPDIGMAWAEVPSRNANIIEGRKLNIACVGIGGRGAQNLGGMAGENIVALCDVQMGDEQRKSAAKFPDAKVYKDYRKMLMEMDDQIDAVVVSTPDHTHFPVAMMALQMGKHTYVEKPISHTIEEARKLTEMARKKGAVTQCGNGGHAREGIRRLVEWVRADAIGDVREVHVWTYRPVKQGPYAWTQGLERPSERMPVPANLDWNLWLGPAPYRDYHSQYMPGKWRGWWDFGAGVLGDMGCHMLDAPFWALDLKYPERVEVDQEGATKESGPVHATVTYSFPARGKRPPVKVFWYENGRKPPRPEGLEEGRKLSTGGMYMVGDKGVIMDQSDYCNSPRLVPETAMRAFAKNGLPEKTIPRVPSGSSHLEWIKACKGEGPKPGSNFDYSGPLTEMVLMGNLAVRMDAPIEWDGENMVCTNLKEANDLVSKKYRVF